MKNITYSLDFFESERKPLQIISESESYDFFKKEKNFFITLDIKESKKTILFTKNGYLLKTYTTRETYPRVSQMESMGSHSLFIWNMKTMNDKYCFGAMYSFFLWDVEPRGFQQNPHVQISLWDSRQSIIQRMQKLYTLDEISMPNIEFGEWDKLLDFEDKIARTIYEEQNTYDF